MVHPVADFRPTDAECRALVNRIIAGKEFRRATRLRDFLAYAVDRKLAGSPRELTESVIGQRVFGRPPMYNTGEDSIVRTEARILRQKLESYFAAHPDEPAILEIPKGSYVPAFRPRENAAPAHAPETSETRERWTIAIPVAIVACLLMAGAAAWRFAAASRTYHDAGSTAIAGARGAIQLESSDPQLVRIFQWAKQHALECAYTGDPVGDWYDSTAGNRFAFCMRDVSHQSAGAAALGLSAYTRNMLGRFAAGISATRNWCGFWEINKDGFPAPIDYRDDAHFWYCLPANFDVLRACYRQFLWTGDESYFNPICSNFYDRTVTDYVAAWSPDRDGVIESSPKVRPRGIPSYYQGSPYPLVGADLIAAQYASYLAYAAIEERRGKRGSLSQELAREYRGKASALRAQYNTHWWNPAQNRYYPLLLPDRTYYQGEVSDANVYALWFGITEDGAKTDAALDSLEKSRPAFDQTLSYFPEVLFRYGRNESAYRFLLALGDPEFRGRAMPEVVFAVVGAVAQGLMGVSPDAPDKTLQTLPRLPAETQWVKLSRVPVLQNLITVKHNGNTETALTNNTGPAFQWKVSFASVSPGNSPCILVDGLAVPATVEQLDNHRTVVSTLVTVKPRQTRTAKYLISKPS